MISDPDAYCARPKNDKRAQRIILNSHLWGNRTRTAAADHPLRRSQERSGVILENGIDGLRPSGFGHGLEAHFVPFEEGLEFFPLDS
jgi:hypothetical protein